MAQQIESKDIQLYASEKLNDAPDGGGRVTANIIESGQINNVFQDISRVDHANGAVELRKLFMGIRTANNAPLLGAHMLIVEPPKDDNVTTLIFQTPKERRETDTRVAARDYLENYFIKSARQFVQPLGLNVEGSNTLTLFAPLSVPVEIKAGDTIVLYDAAGSGTEEYVKISSVSVTRQRFVYKSSISNQDYQTFDGQMVRCQLVSPLARAWDGGEARPSGVTNDKLSVFSTVITNAARYRGATKLTQPLAPGETNARVENVLQPLVPVARLEQALVGKSPYDDVSPVIRGTEPDETPLQFVVAVGGSEPTGALYLPTPVSRSSLSITAGSNSWHENGGGTLIQDSGSSLSSFEVNYSEGIVEYSAAEALTLTISYLPAAAAIVPAVTTGVEITQANLGLVYTFDLSDLPPEPYTLHLQYMSTGDWLAMSDDGQGSMVGQGVGSVNYTTGQVQVTLQREPELGSYILLSFLPSKEAMFERESGLNQAEDVLYSRQLEFGTLIKPGSLSVKNHDGTLESTDDGVGGFSGTAGEGSVDYARGRVTFTPSASPRQEVYLVTADTSDTGRIRANYDAAQSGGNVSFSIGQNVMPGTVVVELPYRSHVKRTAYEFLYKRKTETISKEETLTLRDNGSGVLKLYGAGWAYDSGTINYTTGAVSLPGVLKQEDYQDIEATAYSDTTKVQYQRWQQLSGKVAVNCLYDTQDYQQSSKELSIDAATIRITNVSKNNPIIPRCLWLKINGEDYFDDGSGRVLTGYSLLTGSGVQVGNIDYINGMLDIRDVAATAANVQVKSLVTLKSGMTSSQLIFAIKDRPLRHSSYQMNITTIDGTTRRYISDENGSIKVVGSNTSVGTIDYQTGVVIINAASLGTVEERSSVLGSLRYNAVRSESLPVDPDIVGLNVQRLPIDGRVPIFKLGDTVVLNHEAEQAIDAPVPGQTVVLDRDHLAEVSVLCDGYKLAADQYEIDLEMGEIVFADPFTAKDEAGDPLYGDWAVRHRIEHMSIATRVQQNGQITLQVPSAHEFPASTTVSSALLFGDLQADVLNLFSQKTWQTNSPNWSNQPDASGETTARYDTINYPIQVSNESAVTDRWALVFRSTNSVDIVSENLGVIVTNAPIGSQISPINPVTEAPYFVIEANGWGGGWATGNALRFDTQSALAPFWISRTVTPAQGITESDGFTLSPRGDSQ